MSGSPATAPSPPLRDERRLALVVATETYRDPSLRQLRAPARDVRDLTDVLADPEVGGFAVTSVIDKAAHEIRLAIEEFLDDRRTDDLLLLYLSCHGLVDPRRRLFFAASDTLKNRLAATGVEAQWLLDQLDDCRARRQAVVELCSRPHGEVSTPSKVNRCQAPPCRVRSSPAPWSTASGAVRPTWTRTD